MQRMLRTHQTAYTFKTHKMMDKERKFFKPGQLFTFGNLVYQVRRGNRRVRKGSRNNTFAPCNVCELCQGYHLECIDTYSKNKGSLNEFCINNLQLDCYIKRIK